MVQAALDEAIARAERAWPDVRVARESFTTWLDARGANERTPEGAPALATLHVEDLYLTCACAEGNAAAIARLEEAHFHEVPIAMARLRMPEAERDELKQRLRRRILVAEGGRPPRIAEYSGRGALAHWMRAVATRLAIDALRASGRELPSDEDTFASLAAPDPGPEMDHMKTRYADAFRVAVRAVLADLEPERRTEMRLYYLDGLTLEDIGRLHGVAPSTVARRIGRTREEILARTRAKLRTDLGVERNELESILELIASRMEITRGPFEG